MTPIATLQKRAIQAAQESGAEMFLGLPDAWYEPRPEYGCNNGHVSSRYIKSDERGALCPACLKPVAMLPHGYTNETLSAALAAIKDEAAASPATKTEGANG